MTNTTSNIPKRIEILAHYRDGSKETIIIDDPPWAELEIKRDEPDIRVPDEVVPVFTSPWEDSFTLTAVIGRETKVHVSNTGPTFGSPEYLRY